jgi:hypothetical protein
MERNGSSGVLLLVGALLICYSTVSPFVGGGPSGLRGSRTARFAEEAEAKTAAVEKVKEETKLIRDFEYNNYDYVTDPKEISQHKQMGAIPLTEKEAADMEARGMKTFDWSVGEPKTVRDAEELLFENWDDMDDTERKETIDLIVAVKDRMTPGQGPDQPQFFVSPKTRSLGWGRLYGEYRLTTGGENEISYFLPRITRQQILAQFSIGPIFFAGIAVFTAGALIESQRFFPDAMYW